MAIGKKNKLAIVKSTCNPRRWWQEIRKPRQLRAISQKEKERKKIS